MKAEFLSRAQRNQTTVINTVTRVGGNEIAKRLEKSDSTISRFKNGDLTEWAEFLACAGLKIVPEESVCYSKRKIEAIFTLAQDNVAKMRGADDLADDDPE